MCFSFHAWSGISTPPAWLMARELCADVCRRASVRVQVHSVQPWVHGHSDRSPLTVAGVVSILSALLKSSQYWCLTSCALSMLEKNSTSELESFLLSMRTECIGDFKNQHIWKQLIGKVKCCLLLPIAILTFYPFSAFEHHFNWKEELCWVNQVNMRSLE